MTDGASAPAQESECCGASTSDGDECELPASRPDGRCHIHTAAGGADEPATDYEEMAATLDVAITEARRKVQSGRVRDADREKVRIKWVRALAYAVNVRRQVTTDRDLEELTEEVERLKAQQDGDGVVADFTRGES
jgi:hypothetical protein